MRNFISALMIAAAFGITGCGTRAVDYPLTSQQQNHDQRSIETTPEGAFIILAFSGGGSRAAALAASVTAQLDAVTYTTPSGVTRKLSQDIAVVSSVSGGSVYATYLALNGPSKEEARAFEDHIQTYNGLGYIAGRLLNPVTWVKLQLENTTRVDILQDMITDFLNVKDTKLSVLNQPKQPVFLLNASDMVAGHVFTFDPISIDDLCMNYDTIPLSLATTASADFPGAFTPVLLKNDSYPNPDPSAREGCVAKQFTTVNLSTTLRDARGAYANLESYRYLRYRDSLRGGMDSFRRPQYVRLVDGGVVDNLGLTSVRMGLFDPLSPFFLNKFIRANSLKRLVVIVVNARSDKASQLDGSPKYTTLPEILDNVSGVLVDSASAGAASTFGAFILNLAEERNELVKARVPGAAFNIYPIDIDFDQLPSATEDQRKFLNEVKSIATSWTLKDGDIMKIDEATELLLWRHPCFRQLLANLQVTPDPSHPMSPALCTAPPLPAP